MKKRMFCQMLCVICLLTAGCRRLETVSPSVQVLDVPTLCQYPSLPTGCEATAAAMVLRYYGVQVTAEEVAGWLPCDRSFYYAEDGLHGPDPYTCFVGDPFTDDSYGCFAPVIASAVNQKAAAVTATVVNGQTLDELCAYLDQGAPLLVWVTMELREVSDGTAWTLPNGESFVWPAGEHCMVLVGYDERVFYLNDPRSGTTVTYDRTLCETRFAQLGQQAVWIRKRDF